MTIQAEIETAPDWRRLISLAVTRRTQSRYAGYTAALRGAAVSATERNAFAHTEPYLSSLNQRQRVGARRAAGICAASPGAHQPSRKGDGKSPYRPIGQSLRDLYVVVNKADPSTLDGNGVVNNAMLMQINSLPMLDVEQAAAVFGLLVSRCSDHGITVDYFDMARTLIDWGNAISTKSQQSRSRVLTDFYSS